MFSTIDNYLIHLAQWVVRQLELYTSITRRHLLYFFIVPNALCCLVDIAFIFNCLSLFLEPNNTSNKDFLSVVTLLFILLIALLFILLLFMHTSTIISAIKIAKNPIGNSMLPKEIINNYWKRELYLLDLFVFFLSLFMLTQAEVTIDVQIIFYFCYLVIACLAFPLILEYFLCTTSLPPGEKEKRKIKKEIEKMVPQGS